MSELLPVPAPPWLRAKLDQRSAEMAEKITPDQLDSCEVVLTMLTEPAGFGSDAVRIWEHTCDCCGLHSVQDVITGNVVGLFKGRHTVVIFAACAKCMGQ